MFKLQIAKKNPRKNDKQDSILSNPVYQALTKIKEAFEKLSLQNNVTETEYQNEMQKDMDMMDSYEYTSHLDLYGNFKDNTCHLIREEIDRLSTEIQDLYQDKWDSANGSC